MCFIYYIEFIVSRSHVTLLSRYIDDFLILNDDSIRISKIISVFVKFFSSGTAIRLFSDGQNCNDNSASIPCVNS